MEYDTVDTTIKDIDTGKTIKTYRSWYPDYSAKTWAVIVCCIVIVIVFGLFIFFMPWYYYNDNNYYIHQIEQQMKSQSTQFTSQGLYSLGRSLSSRTEYDLCLSHMTLYHIAPGSDPAVLEVTVKSRFEENRLLKHHTIRTQFNLRYNVAPDKLGYDTNKLEMRKDERFVVLHYEVASSYAAFSSIRFIESTLDSKKSIVPRRVVTLCSNDPSGLAKKCNRRSANFDGMLIMNNTRILHMDQPNTGSGGGGKKHPPSPPGSTNPRNRTSNIYVEPKDVDDEEEGEGGEEIEDSNEDVDYNEVRDNTNALINDITHTRFYNILFYREDKQSMKGGNDYSEYVALSVEPTKC